MPLIVTTLLLPAVAARAQTATFIGSPSLVNGIGNLYPTGVAVDAAGNVYVATSTTGYLANEILKITPGVGSSVLGLGGYTLNAALGLAVDGSGYLYIVDSPIDGNNADNRVLKVKTDGTGATAVPAGTLYGPQDVAVDTAGNVYITDLNNGSRVVEVPSSGGSYGPPVDFVSASQSIGAEGVLNAALGIGVDHLGNVFVTDVTTNGSARLIEVTPSGTASELISSTQSIGSGGTMADPFGVQVDALGDIFIADLEESDFLGRIVELPYSPGGYGSPIEYVPSSTNIVASPEGLAIDSEGNLYASDYDPDAENPSGSGGVIEIATQSTDFGSIAVGSSNSTYSLNFVFDSAGSLNATIPYKVLTLGASGLDFAVVTSGTNCSGSFSAGGTCTVKFKFAPKYAGLRMGAVELVSGSGSVITTAYVRGTGTGPQVVFSPGTQSTLNGGFGGPVGVAVDASGNVYVGDGGNDAVDEIPVGCATSSCVTTLGGGFGGPAGIAVDGSGNLYVADTNNSAVYEVPAGCTSSSCVTTLGGGFGGPDGVAVDGSGNVYVADTSNGVVEEMPAGCASSSCVTPLGVGGVFNAPTGVAVDASGNVFVADQANSAVYEISASCIAGANNASCVTTPGGGFSFLYPYGVTVGGDGNVYVADWGGNAVYEMPAGCASPTCVATLGGSFSNPVGVALDGSGNIYVSNSSNTSVVELDRADVPSLSFGSTIVGQTSSAQTVTLENFGNMALTFPVPSTGNNPSVAANFTLSGATTCPELDTSSSAGTLAVGASCTLAVEFAPTDGGSIGGSVIVKDNHLNAAGPNYTTQSISLSGTGQAVAPGAPTIGTVTPGNGQVTVNFTPPSSDGGAAITSYRATSSPGGKTGTCAASPCTVTGLTNGTAYTFKVTATNSAGTGSASAASGSVTPRAPQTITFNNPGTQNFGTTPTLAATASSGLTVTFSSSTTGVCTVTSGGALTFVSTGTCTINANQAGNTAYSAAAQVSQSFTVTAVAPGPPTIGTGTSGNAQATVSFTPPSSNGGASITSYTATSSPGGMTGSCAASPCTVTGLTNGTAYTFKVTATNSIGTGSASAASGSVTPQASQTITFNNPGTQNFGTTPTLTATASSGLTVTFSSTTTGVCAVTSGGALTFASTGTCTINANQAGNGTYSAAAQVSQSFTIAAVVPGAPTIGAVTAGVQQATVNFTGPVFTGGAAITGYTATSNPGGVTGICASSPCVVTGLNAGTSYTFAVTATNAAGTGPASAASNAVTTPIPNLVVTTAADDAGTVSNCTPQSTPGTGTDAACSLRDALLYAASAGAANISFDSTAFAATNTAAQNTITLGSAGTLTIPTNTAITGATSGSGATLTNLVTVSGNNTHTVFTVNSGITGVVIANLTITKGNSGFGGGIYNAGTLTVTGSTFSGNASSNSGGGIYNSASSTLTLTGSTFSGNSATNYGGGIYNGASSTLTVTGSTFSGNSTSIYDGGGIQNSGTVTGTNITVSGNTSGRYGGGIEEGGGSSLTLANSIVAGNSANSRYADVGAVSFTNNGGNQASNSTSTTSTINASLAPLGSYGGPTQTMLPLPGSPAICAGALGNVGSVTADQRGDARTTNYGATTCVDAGAVETVYSLTFTQQPGDEATATALAPAPIVQLDESGTPIALSGVSISMSAAAGTLSGTTTESTAANGQATFGDLSIGTPQSGDTLTASMILTATGSPAITANATSSAFNIAAVAPTITFTVPDHTYGDAAFPVSATSNSSGTITYSVVSGPATISGGTVTLTGAGTVTLEAAQAASGAYAAGTQDATFNVAKATPPISWMAPAAIAYGKALTAAQLNASSTVAGSFTYTPATGAVLAAGMQALSLTFTPTDTADYTTATATVNLTVNKATPPISWTAPAAIVYGNALTAAQLNASSTVAGSFTYTPATGAVLAAGTQTLSLTFTPTDTANYTTATATVNLTVNKATPSISWTTPAAIAYGDALSATQLNASSTVAGSFTYTPALGAVLAAGAQILSATFAPTGTANYTTATATVNLAVNKATEVISGPPATLAYGSAGTATATVAGRYSGPAVAAPSGSVSYTINGGSAQTALLANGTATLDVPGTLAAGGNAISISYGGDSNYQSGTGSVALTVGTAMLTVSANNATKIYGTANPVFTGSISGAINGETFTENFTTAATTSSNVGTYAIVPSAAGADLGNYTETIQNGALTVTQAGSAVALTSSIANANLNTNVTFTATVTSATTGTPTGMVEFLDGSIVLASSELNAQGVATYSTTNLGAGAHSIHAVYAGDQNFTGSSIALAQQVAAPDYSLTADSASLTLKAGQTGEVTFTFAPVGGYTGTVNFACSGLPANVSCSFAPPSLTADGSNKPQTSQLTITTEGPNTGTIGGSESEGTGGIAAGSILWLPGLLLGCFLLWQRKKLSAPTRRLLGMLILVAAICWATGCGFEPPQAPDGAHTVTVTATATASASGSGAGSGATSHTATFALTITQ
ncbi:MAG TPA: Ig-like domain repeat protein [Terracidiphilus sp.]